MICPEDFGLPDEGLDVGDPITAYQHRRFYYISGDDRDGFGFLSTPEGTAVVSQIGTAFTDPDMILQAELLVGTGHLARTGRLPNGLSTYTLTFLGYLALSPRLMLDLTNPN